MKVLIHIGYHKTGTTFLQENVFENDDNQINTVSRKLIYEIIVKPHQLEFNPIVAREKLREHLDSSRLNVLSHERLSGQPHFGSRDNQYIAVRLKEVFPEAQILIGIREQRSMLFSLHNQYIKAFGTLNFIDYFNNTNMRNDLVFNKRILNFSHLIEFYIGLFSRERVLVMPFEILKMDNETFLKYLGGFVKNDFFPKHGVLNASSTQIELQLWRKLNPFINYNILHIEYLLYNKVFAKFLRLFVRATRIITSAKKEKELVFRKKRIIQNEVGSFYKVDNNELSKLIDFDLKSLGYDL